MNDQYYRLVNSWTRDEWPMPYTPNRIAELNAVAAGQTHYALEPDGRDGVPDRVELYEYSGEKPVSER